MRALDSDEKLVMVMAYTRTMLVRGGLIAHEGVRVSTWLRNQAISNYLQLMNPQVIVFGTGVPKSITYSEIYVPPGDIIIFHIAPPEADPLDYDVNEVNRSMLPVTALAGAFSIKAKIRVSSQTDLGKSLDVLSTSWISLYEAEVTNPNISQFNLQVPMLLVNSNAVSFGV